MSTRIQVVLENNEKVLFQNAAKKRGMSMSAWLKECARREIEELENRTTPRTRAELKIFFKACDEREAGSEPDWDEQKRVIQASVVSGNSDS